MKNAFVYKYPNPTPINTKAKNILHDTNIDNKNTEKEIFTTPDKKQDSDEDVIDDDEENEDENEESKKKKKAKKEIDKLRNN